MILLDEFDRIGDSRGLASIIKALSSEKVTFLITGVARTIQELVRDHESVGRQLAGGVIHLPPMASSELNEIFDTAERITNRKYLFDYTARLFAIYLSRGHPFYVHLLGKYALLRAQKEGVSLVTEDLMKNAWDEIAQSRAAPIQDDIYRKAIGVSYAREFIIKRLALIDTDSFFTTDVYPTLAGELGVSSSAISRHIRQLCSELNIIEQTHDRHYRFTDSLFRAYAAARPFVYRRV